MVEWLELLFEWSSMLTQQKLVAVVVLAQRTRRSVTHLVVLGNAVVMQLHFAVLADSRDEDELSLTQVTRAPHRSAVEFVTHEVR